MDAIKRQLSEVIKQKNNLSAETADLLALKEIVMSGLSRWGFLKEFDYLSDFDHLDGKKYFLIFLNQNSADFSSTLENFISFIEIELKAFGIIPQIEKDKNGIIVKNEAYELSVCIINENYALNSVISYHAEPLPYELRRITSMNEGIRRSIEKIIEKIIEKEILRDNASEQNKNGAAKAPSKNKRKKKTDDSVQQLSLFDF
jgi:hypothetical protein